VDKNLHDRSDRRLPAWPRQAIAEFVGTFFVTFASAGIEIVDALFRGHIDRTINAWLPR
jgi:hypothetical protein